MTIRLSHQPPKVYFNRAFDFSINLFDSGLHSLLKLNSTGHSYDYHWDHCFPTPFGFGLAADYIEEHIARLSWLTDYQNPAVAAERLVRIAAHLRQKYAELSGLAQRSEQAHPTPN